MNDDKKNATVECSWCGERAVLQVTYRSPTSCAATGYCECGARLTLTSFPREVVSDADLADHADDEKRAAQGD